MKKTAYITAILLFSLLASAQAQNTATDNELTTTTTIQPFTFSAMKDYEGNKRVAYFYINGLANNKEGQYAQNELRKNINIPRFFVYELKEGTSKCMIETTSSVDETALLLLINNAINQYRKTTPQKEQLTH